MIKGAPKTQRSEAKLWKQKEMLSGYIPVEIRKRHEEKNSIPTSEKSSSTSKEDDNKKMPTNGDELQKQKRNLSKLKGALRSSRRLS